MKFIRFNIVHQGRAVHVEHLSPMSDACFVAKGNTNVELSLISTEYRVARTVNLSMDELVDLIHCDEPVINLIPYCL